MYPREYELVFSKPRQGKKCDLDKVSTYKNIPPVEDYLPLLRGIVDKIDMESYDFAVKYKWLTHRFMYNGVRREKRWGNGFNLEDAWGVFQRLHLGHEHRFHLGKMDPLLRITTYFDEFYPNFLEENPFETKFEYPYKNNTLSHLYYVYQMPERLELLAESERLGMSYVNFLDYVLNYILCYNEEHGETYLFIFHTGGQPYIKNLDVPGATKESRLEQQMFGYNRKLKKDGTLRKTRYEMPPVKKITT